MDEGYDDYENDEKIEKKKQKNGEGNRNKKRLLRRTEKDKTRIQYILIMRDYHLTATSVCETLIKNI